MPDFKPAITKELITIGQAKYPVLQQERASLGDQIPKIGDYKFSAGAIGIDWAAGRFALTDYFDNDNTDYSLVAMARAGLFPDKFMNGETLGGFILAHEKVFLEIVDIRDAVATHRVLNQCIGNNFGADRASAILAMGVACKRITGMKALAPVPAATEAPKEEPVSPSEHAAKPGRVSLLARLGIRRPKTLVF